MTYRIIQSSHADTDIDEIVGYISLKLHNPKAARDMIDKLREVYETLSEQPFIYPVSKNPHLAEKGYRWFPIKNYMGLYTVHESTMEVRIARIVYGRRDLTPLF